MTADNPPQLTLILNKNLASIYPPPKKRSRTPSADEKNDIEVSATGFRPEFLLLVDQKPANVVEGSCPPNTTPVVDDAVENVSLLF